MTKRREFNTIYVTRYMGAKYKLLELIVPVIEELLKPGETLIDLMAGTHAVGYALKSRNLIVANDIQYYSEIFGRALISNKSCLNLRSQCAKDFSDLKPQNFLNSWFVKTYGDTYFSKAQCAEIAAIRSQISEIGNRDAKYLYLSVLANAMSLCQSSSGHFAQYFPKDHPRLKSLRAMSVFKEFMQRCEEIEVIDGRFQNLVTRMEVSEIFNTKQVLDVAPAGSLAYLDPPYSSAQYSRYYHLLETVFLDDSPEVNFKGLYRGDRHQSDFCSPKNVRSAFERVIQQSSNRNWNLVISYSDAGLLGLDELLVLCKRYYQNVKMSQREYGHSTQGRGIVSNVNEVVISCS